MSDRSSGITRSFVVFVALAGVAAGGLAGRSTAPTPDAASVPTVTRTVAPVQTDWARVTVTQDRAGVDAMCDGTTRLYRVTAGLSTPAGFYVVPNAPECVR